MCQLTVKKQKLQKASQLNLVAVVVAAAVAAAVETPAVEVVLQVIAHAQEQPARNVVVEDITVRDVGVLVVTAVVNIKK